MVAPAVLAAGIGGAAALGGAAASFFGARDANDTNEAIAAANRAMQYDFAQHGLGWRIEDAAKWNISPLAAIGAVPSSAQPVSQVFDSPTAQLAPYINDFGQNISRSVLAMKTPEEKKAVALDLAKRSKENDLLDTQILLARKNLLSQPGTPPGMPAWTTVLNRDGTTSVIPTQESAQASHGESFGPLMWQIHNGLIPQFQWMGEAMKIAPDIRGTRFFGQPGNYWPH